MPRWMFAEWSWSMVVLGLVFGGVLPQVGATCCEEGSESDPLFCSFYQLLNDKQQKEMREIFGEDCHIPETERAAVMDLIFGRGTEKEKRKPNYMRFGRRKLFDKRGFFGSRFDKRKPNSMRFGKRKPNSMRFGRSGRGLSDLAVVDPLIDSRSDFLTAEKRKPNSMRFGRRKRQLLLQLEKKPNFMRFGKRDLSNYGWWNRKLRYVHGR